MNIVLLLFALFERASCGFINTGSVACNQFLYMDLTCSPHLPGNLMCFNHTTKPSKPKGRSMEYLKVPIAFGTEPIVVKLYRARMSWEEALETCIADGGLLVKIDTPRKQQIIENIIGMNDVVWIGLRDTYDNDTYFWSDGSTLNYAKWFFLEPSKKNAQGEKENCVRIQKALIDYSWNDVPCVYKSPFVCEL